MKLRYLFIVVLLGLFISSAWGQTIFSGSIKEKKTGVALQDVMCRVTDVQGKKHLGFAMTDASGNYKITVNTEQDSILLAVTSMGYETAIQKLPNRTQHREIELTEKPFELKEVMVKPPPITKVGDTITYHVDELKGRQDRYIADVLKKLPGIEVSPQGKITYQGVSINKFYIEGLDLLAGKYNVASNNIPADAIDKVQVFENHQPVKAIKDIGLSEAAALNLLLKESYKLKPIVIADVETGFSPEEWLYKGAVVGIQIDKAKQSLLTLKTNNTGENLENDIADQVVRVSGGESGNTLFTPRTYTFPEGIMRPSLFNTAYLATLNHLSKLNNDAQLRVMASYLNEKEWRDYASNSSYYMDENNSWELNESGRLTTHANKLEADVNYNLNTSKTYISNTLKLIASWATANSLLIGTYPNSQRFYTPLYAVNNSLRLLRKMDKTVLNFSSVLSYQNRPQFLRIQLAEALSADELEQTKQNTTENAFKTTNSLSLSHTIGSSLFQLSGNLGAELTSFKSTMNPVVDALKSYKNSNHLSYNSYNFSVIPQYQYKQRSFYADISLPLSYLMLSNTDKTEMDPDKANKNYLFIEPSASIRYKLTRYWETTLSYKYDKQAGDMLNFTDGLRYLNYQTLYYGSGIYEVRKSQSYTFRASYRNQIEALFFHFMAMYRPSASNVINGSYFLDSNRVSYKKEQKNNRKTYFINANIAKYIDAFATNVNVLAGYNRMEFTQHQQNASHQLTSNILNFGCNIDTKLGQKNSLALKLAWLVNQIKSASYNSDNLEQWKIDGEWFLFPAPNWQVSLSGNYTLNELQNDKYTNLFLMNTHIKYQKKNLELTLTGNNILNKKVYKVITYTGLNTFSSSYRLRQREVLLSAKFRL